jgi:hypothetical protein
MWLDDEESGGDDLAYFYIIMIAPMFIIMCLIFYVNVMWCDVM